MYHHTLNASLHYLIRLQKNCHAALTDLRGIKGATPPQDARGDKVTLSTKDFNVQFYTKCAV